MHWFLVRRLLRFTGIHPSFIQGSPTVSLEVRHEWVGQQHNKATSLATHSKMFGVAGPWGRVVPSSPQARPMFIGIERPLVNVGMSLRASGGQVCYHSRELLSTVVVHLRQKRKASKLTLLDSVLSFLCLFTLLVVGGVEMNPGPPLTNLAASLNPVRLVSRLARRMSHTHTEYNDVFTGGYTRDMQILTTEGFKFLEDLLRLDKEGKPCWESVSFILYDVNKEQYFRNDQYCELCVKNVVDAEVVEFTNSAQKSQWEDESNYYGLSDIRKWNAMPKNKRGPKPSKAPPSNHLSFVCHADEAVMTIGNDGNSTIKAIDFFRQEGEETGFRFLCSAPNGMYQPLDDTAEDSPFRKFCHALGFGNPTSTQKKALLFIHGFWNGDGSISITGTKYIVFSGAKQSDLILLKEHFATLDLRVRERTTGKRNDPEQPGMTRNSGWDVSIYKPEGFEESWSERNKEEAKKKRRKKEERAGDGMEPYSSTRKSGSTSSTLKRKAGSIRGWTSTATSTVVDYTSGLL